MGIDNKYGRVHTERGDIGRREPVVVFRAQDGVLPALLAEYARLCREAGSPEKHLAGVAETAQIVVAWQQDPANHVRSAPGLRSDGGTI